MSYTQDDEEFEPGSELDEDREGPDPQDANWNLDPGVIDCPYCGREISEDSSQCPGCRQFISREDAPASKKPLWIIIGLVLIALVLLSWILMG